MTDKTAGFYGTSTIIRENLDYYVDRAEEAATNAEASETAAAQSETNAATSASSAMADASSASTSASNAQLSADQAETARLSAEQASSTAQQSAINADVSATDSANSATASATSAGEALASENKAQQWAEEAEDVQVETGQYSAKHWATKASAAVGLEWGGVGGTLANQTDLVAELSTKAGSELMFQTSRKVNEEAMAASGFVHFGGNSADVAKHTNINQGMFAHDVTPDPSATNLLYLGRGDNREGVSKTGEPIVNIAGVMSVLTQINTLNSFNLNKVKFPDAPDGTVTYDSATGAIVQHVDSTTAFAAETATNKVVTERVDHFGLEGFLEEVTVANPYVYPNGLIQSQATTMNGIATSASARPVTYYAVFDGDTTSAGLGVNFWISSLENQKLMLNDPDNNLFVGEDGKVYQFRIRQRTIAGAGNGDWGRTDVAESYNWFGFGDSSRLIAQGAQDSIPASLGTTAGWYLPANADEASSSGKYQGVCTPTSALPAEAAVNGECYWLPLGTVLRLNQGGFHPSFNRLGASEFAATAVPDYRKWWHGNLTGVITSTADCFNFGTAFGQVGNGSIGTISGRDDGRFYDAIYADGQGGVVDLRLSAQGGTISDILGTEDARTKNGTQRGLQKLRWTTVHLSPATSFNGASTIWQTSDTSGISIGDTISIVEAGTVLVSEATVTNINTNTFVQWDASDGTYVRDSAKSYYAVLTTPTNLSVAGEFSQTDVIGDPAEILATSDLANGWMGNWIPVIPDGAIDVFPLHRKYVGSGSDVTRTYTTNNGSAWTSGAIAISDTVNNETGFTNMPANQVTLYSYTAHAYMTEAADNPVIYKGTEGIGDVWSSSFHGQGNLLAEAVIGEVLTGGYGNTLHYVQETNIKTDGSLHDAAAAPTVHGSVTLPQPDNNSHAVKSLSLVAEENGQLFLYYLSTELIWDTTLDSGAEFTDKTSVGLETYTAGEHYHVTDGRFEGYWYWLSSQTVTLDSTDFYVTEDGRMLTEFGAVVATQWSGNGWGDDNLITVLDGEGTKTDLNGNTVKVSCTKVPYPLEWVKNDI